MPTTYQGNTIISETSGNINQTDEVYLSPMTNKFLITIGLLLIMSCKQGLDTKLVYHDCYVNKDKIENIQLGLSMHSVENYIGCKGFKADIPVLIFKSDSGKYWLAFFPLEIQNSIVITSIFLTDINVGKSQERRLWW